MSVDKKGQKRHINSEESKRDLANACRGVEFEYETQFFDFSPKALVDTVFNNLQQSVDDAVCHMKALILEKYPDTDREALDAAGTKLTMSMSCLSDRIFDKFEPYALDKIFHIPSYVVLPEDEIHETPAGQLTHTGALKLDYEIEQLEKQLSSTRLANESLRSELEVIELVKRRYQDALNQFEPVIASLQSQATDMRAIMDYAQKLNPE